jgi:hypothetical protein
MNTKLHVICDSHGRLFSPGILWIAFRMSLSGSDVQILQMYS